MALNEFLDRIRNEVVRCVTFGLFRSDTGGLVGLLLTGRVDIASDQPHSFPRLVSGLGKRHAGGVADSELAPSAVEPITDHE
jgi:hypothetical protein